MICPECSMDNPPGTLFCKGCSSPIHQGLRVVTALGDGDSNAVDMDFTKMSGISMQVLKHGCVPGEEINLPGGPYLQPLVIGRSDMPGGIIVDLDTTGLGGRKRGVSRRHASIETREEDYYLDDLGSARGTMVNRNAITPGEPVKLSNGDELRLGGLVLKVSMK